MLHKAKGVSRSAVIKHVRAEAKKRGLKLTPVFNAANPAPMKSRGDGRFVDLNWAAWDALHRGASHGKRETVSARDRSRANPSPLKGGEKHDFQMQNSTTAQLQQHLENKHPSTLDRRTAARRELERRASKAKARSKISTVPITSKAKPYARAAEAANQATEAANKSGKAEHHLAAAAAHAAANKAAPSSGLGQAHADRRIAHVYAAEKAGGPSATDTFRAGHK